MDKLSGGKGNPNFEDGLERAQREGSQATEQASEGMKRDQSNANGRLNPAFRFERHLLPAWPFGSCAAR